MKVIAVDSGFGYMKATDGQEEVKYLNIAAQGEGQLFDLSFTDKLIDNLDVKISDGTTEKHYFFGELAKSAGTKGKFIREKDRVNSEYAKASLLTAVALLAGDDREILVATGLPFAHFESLREKYQEQIPGSYTVKFVIGPNKEEIRQFTIVAARVYAQGIGVYFDQVLDSDGEPVSEHPMMGSDCFGIVDIGTRTTNFELFENKRLNQSFCDGLELGMSHAHKAIQKEMSKYDVTLPEVKIEDILRGKNRRVIDAYNLKLIIKNAYQVIGAEISSKIETLWEDKKIDIEMVYVAGGGGQAIFDHIILGSLDVPRKLVENPQFANVRGFYKAAVRAMNLGKFENVVELKKAVHDE